MDKQTSPETNLPFWQSLGGRLLAAVSLLILVTIVVFALNHVALEKMATDAPAIAGRLRRIQMSQFVLAAFDVVIGLGLGLIIRRLLERERNAAREPRLRAVLNLTSDAVVTIDDKAIIHDVNLTTEKLFGYRADELVGRNVSILAASPHREDHDGYMERYLRTGVPHIIGRGRPVPGQHSDGAVGARRAHLHRNPARPARRDGAHAARRDDTRVGQSARGLRRAAPRRDIRASRERRGAGRFSHGDGRDGERGRADGRASCGPRAQRRRVLAARRRARQGGTQEHRRYDRRDERRA
jgi:PAS domain S-box-containing protein